jgi:hypothetical protein
MGRLLLTALYWYSTRNYQLLDEPQVLPCHVIR